MQFAHAGDHAAGRFLVHAHFQRGVFGGVALQGLVQHLALVGIARLQGQGDDRRVGVDGFQGQQAALVAIGLAGMCAAQAHEGHDLAGGGAFQLLAAVGMHAVDAADAVLGLGGGIGQGVALVQAACVDAGKSQLAAVLHEHLEDQHHGGCGGIGRHGHFVALAVAAHGRGHVQRRGQQVADGIQHGLHAAVAQGGAAEHRGHGPAQGGPAQGGAHVLQAVFSAQIQVEEGLVGLGQMLQQAFPPGLGHSGFRIAPGAAGHGAALVGLVEVQMLAGQQIQHAVEGLALPVGDG